MDAKLRASILSILDVRKRVRHLEGIAAGLLAQGAEQRETMAQLKRVTEQNGNLAAHVLRLLRQKECLMEMVGRFILEHQRLALNNPLYSVSIASQPIDARVTPEQLADIQRAFKEMGKH